MAGNTTGSAKKIDIKRFYRETKSEIKKVSWPSRKELIQHTEVVVTSIILVGALLALADFAFGQITAFILGRM